MIVPVNGHLVIEPVKHVSFVAGPNETYEEIGVVIALPVDQAIGGVSRGDKVFFDSWLAAKYPKEDGIGHYWLVKWEDVRAVEYAK